MVTEYDTKFSQHTDHTRQSVSHVNVSATNPLKIVAEHSDQHGSLRSDNHLGDEAHLRDNKSRNIVEHHSVLKYDGDGCMHISVNAVLMSTYTSVSTVMMMVTGTSESTVMRASHASESTVIRASHTSTSVVMRTSHASTSAVMRTSHTLTSAVMRTSHALSSAVMRMTYASASAMVWDSAMR